MTIFNVVVANSLALTFLQRVLASDTSLLSQDNSRSAPLTLSHVRDDDLLLVSSSAHQKLYVEGRCGETARNQEEFDDLVRYDVEYCTLFVCAFCPFVSTWELSNMVLTYKDNYYEYARILQLPVAVAKRFADRVTTPPPASPRYRVLH